MRSKRLSNFLRVSQEGGGNRVRRNEGGTEAMFHLVSKFSVGKEGEMLRGGGDSPTQN